MLNRKIARKKRSLRIRKRVSGTTHKPRLVVFVSNKNFYAQIIDDQKHHTLVACSSLNLSDSLGNNQKTAYQVGVKIAELAKAKNISDVVFDRAGFLFHGKIKSFADGARKSGLKF